MGQEKILVSVFQKAKKDNVYCGDSYFYTETEDEFVCALADGLGSGEFAMESSDAVIEIIKANNHVSMKVLVEKCNDALLGKRGVVLGILKINFRTEMYSFSSIGNIGIMAVTKGKKKTRNIPSSGYLAGFKRPIKIVNHRLHKGTNLIMFSDGVHDKELSQCFFEHEDVRTITGTYARTSEKFRADDTTLIAMRYPE